MSGLCQKVIASRVASVLVRSIVISFANGVFRVRLLFGLLGAALQLQVSAGSNRHSNLGYLPQLPGKRKSGCAATQRVCSSRGMSRAHHPQAFNKEVKLCSTCLLALMIVYGICHAKHEIRERLHGGI